MVVYLKDLSPYRRQFSPYSKSQNTIRVNLLGNHSTSCYYIVNFLFTYTPSPLTEPTVVTTTRFCYTFTTTVTVLTELNNIPPKAPVTTPLTAAATSREDTSMADTNSQLII